jgi:hypothetical protein
VDVEFPDFSELMKLRSMNTKNKMEPRIMQKFNNIPSEIRLSKWIVYCMCLYQYHMVLPHGFALGAIALGAAVVVFFTVVLVFAIFFGVVVFAVVLVPLAAVLVPLAAVVVPLAAVVVPLAAVVVPLAAVVVPLAVVAVVFPAVVAVPFEAVVVLPYWFLLERLVTVGELVFPRLLVSLA